MIFPTHTSYYGFIHTLLYWCGSWDRKCGWGNLDAVLYRSGHLGAHCCNCSLARFWPLITLDNSVWSGLWGYDHYIIIIVSCGHHLWILGWLGCLRRQLCFLLNLPFNDYHSQISQIGQQKTLLCFWTQLLHNYWNSIRFRIDLSKRGGWKKMV